MALVGDRLRIRVDAPIRVRFQTDGDETMKHPWALLAVACAAAAGPALAETTLCTEIASLPATITAQGTYCLHGHLATALSVGNAIEIATNNVTIDCNDHKIGGLAAGPGTQAYGIHATGRSNVTIRHCSLRGFKAGINLEGGGYHVVEDSRFDNNTWVGIRVDGGGSAIRRNVVSDTGGWGTGSRGIIAIGGVDVIDNAVGNVFADLDGGNTGVIGIQVADPLGAAVTGNRIRGLVPDTSGTLTGIISIGSGPIDINGNVIQAAAGASDFGVNCSSGGGTARDNTFLGFSAADASVNCVESGSLVPPP